MSDRFTAETFRFLRDIAKHQNRAWFAANKARYEEHVKAPADAFAGIVAAKLAMEPHVMRIYRDVRFSKDKSPYKTNIGIGFHKAGRVTEGGPGYYLHIMPGESFAGVGSWHPEPPALQRIRDAIVEDPAGWAKVRKLGMDEDEEALKKAPRGFDPAHKFIDDIKRRSFTAGVALSDAQVVSKDFPAKYVATAKKLAPFGKFLARATGTPW